MHHQHENIPELVSSGCAKAVEMTAVICSPLSAVENYVGKKRLVINLRHLSMFLYMQKFRYKDLQVTMLLFKKEDYMYTFHFKTL